MSQPQKAYFQISHIMKEPIIYPEFNFLVWPICNVLHHQNMIHDRESVFVGWRRNILWPGAISMSISPRYHGQNTIYLCTVFSPCYFTVIDSTVFQVTSKNQEQHVYMVGPSKMVELWARERLMLNISFLGEGHSGQEWMMPSISSDLGGICQSVHATINQCLLSA